MSLPGPVIAFLRVPRMARVSTVGADGAPHVVPMWYALDGETFQFTSLRSRQTVRNLRRDPRVTFVVDEDDPQRYAAVVVEGRAALVPAQAAAVARALAERYLGAAAGARYAAFMLSQPDRTAFRVVPERVTHWGLDAPDAVARVLRGESP